jgi:hypothetical protein
MLLSTLPRRPSRLDSRRVRSVVRLSLTLFEHLQLMRYNAHAVKKPLVYRAWRRNRPSSRRGIRGGAEFFGARGRLHYPGRQM